MFTRCGVLLLLMSALESGCNLAPPTSSSAVPKATTYSGSISDSFFGDGALTVALTPVQGLQSGTWSVTYAGKAPQGVQTISGPVSGSVYTAQVTNGSTDTSFSTGCTLLFTGTLTATRLSGSYQRVATPPICPAGTGTIDVAKQ